MVLLLLENIGTGPAGLEVADQFLLGRFVLGPVVRADADDSTRAKSFQNQVHGKLHLDSATAEWGLSFRLLHGNDLALHSVVIRPISTQGVLGRCHLSAGTRLEVGVKRFVHSSEQRDRDVGVPKISVLDRVYPGGHPAQADEADVPLSLAFLGDLDCGLVQPEIGSMKLLVEVSGMPSEGELHMKVCDGILFLGLPETFGNQVVDAEQFATSPDAG